MSLLSRWFGKAPSPSSAPPSAPQRSPTDTASMARQKPSPADRALAATTEEAALRVAVDAGDVQTVARMVVAGSSTKIRQAAAQAIEDAETLRQLIRDVRGGNDKSVYKILTAKRDAQQEQVREQAQLTAEINAVSAALERHSQGPYEASYGSTLDQFEHRWQAVAAQAETELRDSVQQCIARARETVAEHQRQAAARAAEAQAAAHAAAEAQRLHAQQERASAAAAAEQARALDEQKRALAQQQDAEQQQIRQIAESIRKARNTLSAGDTARAAGMRRAIEQQLAGAPPLPAAIASQLQQLDQQLQQLKDWKSFSVTPKRAELIEEMTFLIGASLEPLALAERIKSLQEEWRTLSKGAGEHIEADSQRFQEITQKAYQPCREYFAAQALVRAENLRLRDALLTRLAAFETETNWERADWQAVIKILRDTKQEWRRCVPVERQPGKQQDEALAAITTTLQGRLDAEHDRNVQHKQSLIERAQQLLASGDERAAIDEVKRLQQTWRTVGQVPRELDQRLWGAFRQSCDAVFQKREQAAAAHTAGLEHNKAQAIALCEQIEQIATLEGAELQAQGAVVGELRKTFETLGELPRSDTRELRKRFDRGMERYQASLARQRARDAERTWDDLFDAANQVRAYRLALVQRLDAEQIGALKTAAETGIAAVQQWPKGGLDALQKTLADGRVADLAANEVALRMLCIRAEVLVDLPTPPEDQALRREHQLQRLMQGMGQRLKADEAPLDALAMQWVRVGPVETVSYGPLAERFRRCRTRPQP